MSEQAPEQTQPQQQPVQAQQPAQSDQGSSPETFPLSLVKRPTGDTHWNTAKGIWETVVHGETGEPTQEYALVTTIDGVEVTLQTFNAGGLETIVRSQQQAQQQNAG